jgi:4-hydroxybenzoate polyprenyltransferase/phosphoserine phosphatase
MNVSSLVAVDTVMSTDRSSDRQPSLYVDLDHTLIKSDLLLESALRLVKRAPWSLIQMMGWLVGGGKARLKHELAQRVDLDVTLLPYRAAVVDLCRHAHAEGRRVTLATASHAKFAHQIASHLGFFDAVIASTSEVNMSGRRKLAAIQEMCGSNGFAYVGNETTDLEIWSCAAGAIVCADARLAKQAARVSTVSQHIPVLRTSARTILRAIRIHQWSKNALLFLPLIPLISVLPVGSWVLASLGFVCFGMCASSVYLVNDLLDLDADRRHQNKRHRPVAAGELPLKSAMLLAALLLVASFALAAVTLPPLFMLALLGYWILTNAYSLDLKRRVNVDVIALAVLYTIRILAGSAIIMIKPSFWILAFSVFLFFSLAAAKRLIELGNLKKRDTIGEIAGRGYLTSDFPVLMAQGAAAGQLAVLVFAFYINEPAAAHFRRPEALWMICPLLLLWINRVWMKVNRGELDDDPVIFALRDRFSRVVAAVAALCVAAATI